MLATRMKMAGRYLAASSVSFLAAPTPYNNEGAKVGNRDFASVDIGAADPARIVVCAAMIGGGAESASGTINAMTCNGDAMTVVASGITAESVAIGYIRQSDMSSPSDTTATFNIASSGTFGWCQPYSYRVLAYGAVTSNGANNIGLGTTLQIPSSSVVTEDNHASIGIFGVSSTDFDGISDADLTWLDELVEGDQDNFATNNSGESCACASATFASGDSDFRQRCTYSHITSTTEASLVSMSWAPN